MLSQIAHPAERKFPIQQSDWLQVTKEIQKRKQSMYLFCILKGLCKDSTRTRAGVSFTQFDCVSVYLLFYIWVAEGI